MWANCIYTDLYLFFPSNHPVPEEREKDIAGIHYVTTFGDTCKWLQVLRNTNAIFIWILLKEKTDTIDHLFGFTQYVCLEHI